MQCVAASPTAALRWYARHESVLPPMAVGLAMFAVASLRPVHAVMHAAMSVYAALPPVQPARSAAQKSAHWLAPHMPPPSGPACGQWSAGSEAAAPAW